MHKKTVNFLKRPVHPPQCISAALQSHVIERFSTLSSSRPWVRHIS